MRLVPLFLSLLAGPAAAQTGFPVATHYPAQGGSTPDTSRVTRPAYEVYSAARSDEYAPTRQEFDTAVQLMFQATGVQVRVVNDPSELSEGLAQIQVINNWAIGAALYTVALPPNWRRSGSYPISISGDPTSYSNNYRVYHAQEGGILAYVANRGFITAYSNAGGIESQGVSDGVLRSFGEAVTTFAGLGGDKDRVITAGFSRGAATAFVWAANPLGLDYTVIAAFGHALPTSMLEAVTAPYATYPLLAWLAELVTNDPNTSRYAASPPPHSFPNPVLQVLTGQGSAEVKSPRALAERLRGKQLVFSFGSHDPIVPYASGVAFARQLEAAGVGATAIFVQAGGHGWSLDVANELTRAVDAIGRGGSYTATSGRIYAVDNDLGGHDYTRQSHAARPTMPFSAVLPYRAASGQPMRVDLCGAPGAQYVICAVRDGTAPSSAIYVSGSIGAEECASHALAAPLAQGSYHWFAVVNGSPIPRSLTAISGHQAQLDVLPAQPGAFEGLVGQALVAEGLSELSIQAPSAAVACPPPEHLPTIDAGFADSGFTIGADGGAPPDAGLVGQLDAEPVDTGNRKPVDPSCGCGVAGSSGEGALLAIALLFAWRRKR